MGKEKETVLIVEDEYINREILKTILRPEYKVMEAENGAQALAQLEQAQDIAAILSDIVMPVMDGYTLLARLRESSFSTIPTIVMTAEKDESSEQKALDLGAWDFVSKPYRPTTLMTRLKNVIVRSQFYLLSEMRQLYELDPLTGLYNRSHFFEETRKLLDRNPESTFALVRMDVDHFQSYNSFWGEEEGDKLLRYMAAELEREIQEDRPHTYARINADVFCFCIPYCEERIRSLTDDAYRRLAEYNPEFRIVPSFGVYVIESRAESIQKMYELVTLAAKECKGSYLTYLSYYKAEMSQKVLQNQWIVNEMQNALDSRQFEVYLQPKYNLKTEQPHGGEALVRWRHPERGILSPGLFIPVLEQNGFIGRLDFYMWESVCRLLKKWMDDGIQPGPISVNVSRVNMYNPNLVPSLIQLVKQYDVPPQLLQLEVTESAYMDNPSAMEKIIAELQDAGFVILMDDFGSGYSSLNTLKDIHVNVLKIDMKFLSGNSEAARSRSILASAIRMAGWLNTPVIMEGVETAEQVAFLKSIGCHYAQGYYYAKPMPVSDYEALLAGTRQVPSAPILENIQAVSEILFAATPGCELLLSSMDTPAAIYQLEEGRIRLLRVNNSFYALFESRYGSPEDLDFALESCLPPASIHAIKRSFEETTKSKERSACRFFICDREGVSREIRMSLRYWGLNKTAHIIFAQFFI